MGGALERDGKHWTEQAWWGAVLVVGYLFAASLGLLVAALTHRETDHTFVYDLGRACGLAGIGIILLQFVLAARLHWIERPFGLDLVLRFHKGMAALALVLLVSHPLLLAAGGAGPGLIASIGAPWYIWLGRAALALLLLQVTGSALREQIGVGFERWRLLHNGAAVALLAAAVHALVTGGDFDSPAMQITWCALVTTAVVSYGYHRLLYPFVLARRPYRVSDVRQETHNVWTITLEPPAGGRRFPFRPGQFHFLHLRRGRGLPAEEHHFTISSAPTAGALTSTIKESGDFTRTIGETRPGDPVAVRGPFGRFSYTLRPAETDFVFIAGGIGITPIMSMLRHMRDTAADVDALLIYGSRTEEDIVSRQELDDIAGGERPRLRIVHVLSAPGANWHGETGLIGRDNLARLVGDGCAGKTYYVCGPPPMMKQVFAALRQLGVPANRVEFERFAL